MGVEIQIAPGVEVAPRNRPAIVLREGWRALLDGLAGRAYRVSVDGQEFSVSLETSRVLRRFPRPTLMDDYEYSNHPFRDTIDRYVEKGILLRRDRETTVEHSLSIVRKPHCPDLFYVFTGAQGGLMGPAHEFLALTGLIERNVVMFRDVSRRFYSQGISPNMTSMPALIGWQDGYRKGSVHAKNCYTLGVSMGAFAAMLCGHYLKAKAVWGLGLERVVYEDGERLDDGIVWDLRKLLSEHNGVTEYRLYYNEAHENDRRVAESLAGLPGVRLFPQDGDGHNILAPLVASGDLSDFLAAMVPQSQVARSRPAPVAAAEIRALVSNFLEEITPSDRHFEGDTQLDLDSLSIVQLSAFVESRLSASLGPDDLESLVLGTLDDLVERIERLIRDSTEIDADAAVTFEVSDDSGSESRGSTLREDTSLLTQLDIGMPLTGRNNMAETPLLKYVAELQWMHTSRLSGVLSKDIVDESGARLYATLVYVECFFPEGKPMSSFQEDDRVSVVSTIHRFGTAMLDGRHYICERSASPTPHLAAQDGGELSRLDVPCIRLSSIYVRQWKGAQWLKKSRPIAPGFKRIPETMNSADAYQKVKNAEAGAGFFEVPRGYVPLSDSPIQIELPLEPDRDLNGAGLLYFANYPLFLDLAERRMLTELDRWGITHEILDQRTLQHRRSAYLSNASSRDTLVVELSGWIENPFVSDEPNPEEAPIRLLFDYRMHRKSDGRLMMVSSAKKIIPELPLRDTPLLDALRAEA